MKKRIFVLFAVMVFILAGCGNNETEVALSKDSKTTETEITEEPTLKQPETEESITDTKTESVTKVTETEAPKQEDSNSNKDKGTNLTSNHNDTKDSQPAQDTAPANEPEKTVTPEPTPEQPPQPERVEYSPTNVVALATAKTKAAGKILLTENLDNLLASGTITQDEYNEYYPYDGAGYYSVFVDSNLAEARDVSGTEHFNSEDDIAQYIADMLALESGPYFLIEYAGTYDYYGKTCYEFRCYRA